jgi:phage shock protein A
VRAQVTEMNLFERAVRVMKSYANAIVTSAEVRVSHNRHTRAPTTAIPFVAVVPETSRLLSSPPLAPPPRRAAQDPEKMLEQTVNEMQEDLIKMRQASAQVMASQKQLENKYKQAQATADDWYRRAQLALQKGDEELAREALKRRQTYQGNADSMAAQVAQQKDAVDKLIASTRLLETKMAEARSKKDTLKARAASAKTSKRVNEMVGSLSTSSALSAFDRMEEKVLAMESEADAVAQLTAPDAVSNAFLSLESGGVEDELASMKRNLLGGAAPGAKPELPAGRKVSDAIESELEALRKMAKDEGL